MLGIFWRLSGFQSRIQHASTLCAEVDGGVACHIGTGAIRVVRIVPRNPGAMKMRSEARGSAVPAISKGLPAAINTKL